MQVSVVIPTYNRVTTLSRTIHSVLAQRGVSFEICVVDDGSTDGTKAMVAEISKTRPEVRYFFQQNRGPSAARNRGIFPARGKFIAFLDSDDEWLPGKLGVQLQFFQKHPDCLICQTEEIWIRNGKRVNPMKKHQKFGGFIFEKCLPLSIVSPSCVMMRREFFDQVGFFDETLPACEDYDLWLRTSARFPIGLIEKAYVVRYGGHEDQRSRQFPVMDRFRIQALLKLFETESLTNIQRELVARELLRKCSIVSQGAMKRGNLEIARSYEDLAKRMMDFSNDQVAHL